MGYKHPRGIILFMGEAVATRRITVEVEVPEGAGEDFVRVLRDKAWELYLIYRWLELPEARERDIEELAREAKRRAGRR